MYYILQQYTRKRRYLQLHSTSNDGINTIFYDDKDTFLNKLMWYPRFQELCQNLIFYTFYLFDMGAGWVVTSLLYIQCSQKVVVHTWHLNSRYASRYLCTYIYCREPTGAKHSSNSPFLFEVHLSYTYYKKWVTKVLLI